MFGSELACRPLLRRPEPCGGVAAATTGTVRSTGARSRLRLELLTPGRRDPAWIRGIEPLGVRRRRAESDRSVEAGPVPEPEKEHHQFDRETAGPVPGCGGCTCRPPARRVALRVTNDIDTMGQAGRRVPNRTSTPTVADLRPRNMHRHQAPTPRGWAVGGFEARQYRRLHPRSATEPSSEAPESDTEPGGKAQVFLRVADGTPAPNLARSGQSRSIGDLSTRSP